MQVVKEQVKKSAYVAKTNYEYKKLVFPEPFLLGLVLEEEKEELVLTYDIEGKKSLMGLKQEDQLTILRVLMNLKDLQKGQKEYRFSLSPTNLYYDINAKIYVKERDVYPTGEGYSENKFLTDYRSLVGFALQEKYTYEDFKEGGQRLLEKNPLQNKIYGAENAKEIYAVLLEEYEKIEKERKDKKILLNKKTYRNIKIAITVLSVLTISAAVCMSYVFFREKPYKEAVIKADDAYIEGDYVKCIDAMREVAVDDMETVQKYILANSYVRSENLSQEQKNNILETLSINAAAVRLEYWIYLGRNDTDAAIDIAMQQSDDQLLLYAYMKKKSLVETSTALSGEEKTQQLEEISSKMEPLMEQYDTEEE